MTESICDAPIPNEMHPVGQLALDLYEKRNRISRRDVGIIEDALPVSNRPELYHALVSLEIVALTLYCRLNPPSAERLRQIVRDKADEFKDLRSEFACREAHEKAKGVNRGYQRLAAVEDMSLQAPMVGGSKPSTQTLSLKDLRPRTTVAG